MSKRTKWTRINGYSRTRNVRKGLQARVADPFWMLSRQWQFGAFKGEDTASPVKVHIEHDHFQTNSILELNDKDEITSVLPYKDNFLMEPYIEAEDIYRKGALNTRLIAEAGIQFLRFFPQTKRARLLQELQKYYPLKLKETEQLGKAAFLKSLIRNSFNAAKFYGVQEQEAMEFLDRVDLGTAAHWKNVKIWKEYYNARFVVPRFDNWDEQRLEYSCGVQTERKNNVQIALKADGYAGGDMDWYHFDFWGKKSLKPNQRSKKVTNEYLIPTSVRYAGMPADRFWDFEDGKVFFGGLKADKTDLAQILLTEFATVYSNDWYMLPVRAKTGGLSRIQSIHVVDCFGERHESHSTAHNDGERRDWRFFELTGDTAAEAGMSPWLYVPRTVLGGHEDKAVEKVVFTRDEMANMAWGIEETIEGASGHRISRHADYAQYRDEIASYLNHRDNTNDGDENDDEDQWLYRFISTVPPYWVPFSPHVEKNYPTGMLQRARMSEWDLLDQYKVMLAGAKGHIMAPDAPLYLHEEEIPRGAIDVTRHYQSARDVDGRVIVWNSRKKRPSSGNKPSGRKTDMIEIEEKKAS